MKSLFDQAEIGGLILKNRFLRAAVGDKTTEGRVDEETIELYRQTAAGGVGAIITGFTRVENEETDALALSLYDDSFLDGHRRLTAAVHEHGARIILQIAHAGSYCQPKNSRTTPILGPSPVVHHMSNIRPKEMTAEEIQRVRQSFASAARRGMQAGYDGVEIHGAHAFLLSLFLTPWYNRRRDNYGGSVANRARFLIETYDAVRAAVGQDYPVWVKINSHDFMPDGITVDECSYVCGALAAKGANALEISGNWFSILQDPGTFFQPAAARIAAEIKARDSKTDVILTGGNREITKMTDLLNSSAISAFGMARPFLLEPGIIKRFECEAQL